MASSVVPPYSCRRVLRKPFRLTLENPDQYEMVAPSSWSLRGNLVGGTGIEPVTPSMSRKCSTAELTARLRVTCVLRFRTGVSLSMPSNYEHYHVKVVLYR